MFVFTIFRTLDRLYGMVWFRFIFCQLNILYPYYGETRGVRDKLRKTMQQQCIIRIPMSEVLWCVVRSIIGSRLRCRLACWPAGLVAWWPASLLAFLGAWCGMEGCYCWCRLEDMVIPATRHKALTILLHRHYCWIIVHRLSRLSWDRLLHAC